MTRRSVVSGLFYPDSPGIVMKALSELGVESCDEDCPDSENPVFGVLAPHASLECCGHVAASVWRRVCVSDRVIIIGPNHTGMGAAAAVATARPFSTPVGTIQSDAEMGRELTEERTDGSSILCFDDSAHEEEHSIESVLPFIQKRNPATKFTAICLRTMSFADCEKVAAAVAGSVRKSFEGGRNVLIVASSDLNHNEPQRISERKDRLVLDRVQELDAQGLYRAVVDHNISMCGMTSVVVMILAARQLGAGWGELVAYGTSMDFTGDPSSVVGYGGAVLRAKCPADNIRHLDGETRPRGRRTILLSEDPDEKS